MQDGDDVVATGSIGDIVDCEDGDLVADNFNEALHQGCVEGGAAAFREFGHWRCGR